MSDETVELKILAALDTVVLEPSGDGEFKLVCTAPAWLADFFPDGQKGTSLRPQDTFLFLAGFLGEAEELWDSQGEGLLRSGAWTEGYSANKQLHLEASALKLGGRKLLVIERARSAFGDVHAMIQKVRDKNLDYERLRQAQEALRKSEERYRDLFENATDLIQSCAPDGRLLYVNRAWCQILGYTEKEASSLRILDIVHPTSREYARKVFDRVIAGERADRIEFKLVTKAGQTISVEGNSSCRFEGDKPIATRSIFRDVTERKKMEAELAKARDVAVESARLKAEFLANMSHEIRTPINAVVGMAGLLLDTDLTAEQREFAETVRGSADSLLTIINDILDFSKIEAGKLAFETIDFDLRRCVEGGIDLLSDAAQSKGVELLLAIDSDVPQSLRGDPGRLRQVLTNLLSNAVKFTEHGETIVRVRKESEALGETTLHFSVSDTGIGIPEQARSRIFEAFSQADGSTTRKYGGTGLGLAISKQLVEMMQGRIGVESEAGKGSNFWFTARFQLQAERAAQSADKHDLEGLRVLVVDDNPTNRAIVHHQVISWRMRNGTVSSGAEALEVLRREAAKGDPYDIAILDMQMPEMDGLMLAREIKADESISRTRLVMMSSSRPHKENRMREAGIEVCLRKPVKQAQLFDCLAKVTGRGPGQAAAAESAAQPRRIRGVRNPLIPATRRQARILVAEDNAANRRVVLLQLQKYGYSADGVANGLEALEALKRIPYDVVLMDCQMPEMDGFQATQEIRGLEQGSKHTTIVAMTASALEGERERCLAAGMDDYLSKPVRPEDIVSVIEGWIGTAGKRKKRRDAQVKTTSGEVQVIDMTVISSLRALQARAKENLLAELIETFRTDSEKKIAAMRAAVENRDAEALCRAAHALKGGSGIVGANRMVSLCDMIEEMGRSGSTDGALALIITVEEEFGRASRALQGEKANSAHQKS